MQFVCRVLIVEFQWPMISNSNVGMFTVAFYCVIFNILIQIKPWMFPYLYILKYLVTFFLIILSEREITEIVGIPTLCIPKYYLDI